MTPPAEKPDPQHCSDCGPSSPPPVPTKATAYQREFVCSKCGLLHIVGNQASVYPTRVGRAVARED